MSDYGRYESETRNRDRDRERGGFSRNSDSIFGFDRERNRRRDRDEEMGGWAGSGRTSAYDEDRDRGRWTSERENLGSSRHRGEHMGGRYERMDRERHFGRDDYREGLPIDETSRLIASNKVEGTAVYGSDDERLGSIYNFMVNKFSGRVEYAVMSYGGFLGMGTRYYPLPWQTLSYDTDRGGYRIEMRERDLRDAPSFDRNSEPRFDRQYGERVNSWYGVGY